MIITRENQYTILPDQHVRVIKNGTQVGMIQRLDTDTKEYIQKVPVAWRPSWEHGQPVLAEPDIGWATNAFRLVTGVADEIVFVPRSEA